MEETLAALVPGQPVPTRKELFIDYGIHISHSVVRVRLARPELYARYLELEQLARDEAKRLITKLVQDNVGAEHTVSKQLRDIAYEYGVGQHTLCAWRKEARGGKSERAAWDWKRVMKIVRTAIATKDRAITSLDAMAQRIGSEYHITGTGNSPSPRMSKNTLYDRLSRDEDLYEKFLALCSQNRRRLSKEVK